MVKITPLFLVCAAYLATSATGDAWSDSVLASHNAARARYGARPLTWSAALYASTAQFASSCKYQHSNAQGRYGENLFASPTSSSINTAVSAWMSEASKYNYNHPGFSAATGQFTQAVWKSTTSVACAVAACPAGTVFASSSNFFVCRYTPPGNSPGQFPQNVGRPV